MKASRKVSIAALAIALSSLTSGLSRESVATYSKRSPLPVELYIPTPGKRVACFLTINSSDEKLVFTKYLNPAEWDLVEVTAPAGDGNKAGWFGHACAKNIQCDINVISGHFAGKFFGESGYDLALSELENRSCAQDCRGILENPREVYLLGCNTLASKDLDHRTPEEYYQVLREDNYSHETATRVVEDRYGAFGQDNKGKMQRSFLNVPYIYGFHSTSPKGIYLGPMIEKYLKSLGNFTKHFDSIRNRGLTAKDTPNTALVGAMKGQKFSQCSGLNPNDPQYDFHLKICALFDNTSSLEARLNHAEVMMNSDHLLSLLPSIKNFLSSNILEIKKKHATTFAKLQANENARTILMDTANSVKSSMIKIEWIRFAHLIGWVDRKTLDDNIHQLVNSAFGEDYFVSDIGRTICSLRLSGLDQMDFSRIISILRPHHLDSDGAVETMSCIGLARYPAFRDFVNETMKSKTSFTSNDTSRLATIFFKSPPLLNPSTSDRELLARLQDLCVNYPIPFISPSCGRSLSNLGAGDPSTAPLLIEFLRNANPSLQMTYADVFRSVEAAKGQIETAMLDVYLEPNHPYWYGIETYFMSRPILSPSNQKRMLTFLITPTDSRRPESMLYALKEMKLSASEFTKAYTAIRNRKNGMMTGAVLLGWLNIAVRSGISPSGIEKIFLDHRSTTLQNGSELKAFYDTLALPGIRSITRTSKTAQDTICRMMKSMTPTPVYDEFGELMQAGTPIRSCAELF